LINISNSIGCARQKSDRQALMKWFGYRVFGGCGGVKFTPGDRIRHQAGLWVSG